MGTASPASPERATPGDPATASWLPERPLASAVGVPGLGVLRGVVQAGDVDVVGAVGGHALGGGDGADGGLHELLVGDGGTGDDVDLGGVADLGEVVGVLLIGGDGGLRLLVVVLVEDLTG